MSTLTTDVKPAYEAVYCPHCKAKGRRRYLGAFVGKAQCPSCKAWLIVDSAIPASE